LDWIGLLLIDRKKESQVRDYHSLITRHMHFLIKTVI
jgi:hypothetical protein